ncbi:MAG: hypothetical protein IPN09_13400 [Bacteroidetes bacterium]|nr:hypothetical protein [Bacteroidota bacterium]
MIDHSFIMVFAITASYTNMWEFLKISIIVQLNVEVHVMNRPPIKPDSQKIVQNPAISLTIKFLIPLL